MSSGFLLTLAQKYSPSTGFEPLPFCPVGECLDQLPQGDRLFAYNTYNFGLLYNYLAICTVFDLYVILASKAF